MELKQTLLCISLGLFFIELFFYLFIKHKLEDAIYEDPLIDQLVQLFEFIQPHHYFIYVCVYIFLLFLAKLWIYLFLFILSIQTISVVFDIYVTYKVLKRSN